MGLIYVNPEGPDGNPDPIAAAKDIRETFARMAMNDEETVALIAGGHTFGKTHGAGPAVARRARARGGRRSRRKASAGRTAFNSGTGADAITSGLEVTWTTTPTKWSNDFFKHLFGYEWELTKSPAGAHQWKPKGGAGAGTVPDAHDAVEAHRAVDADDRPLAPLRPGVREDLAALHGSTRTSSPTRSRARGSSSLTATWGRARATSARRSRPRSSSGRTRSPRSITRSSTRHDVAALKSKVLASGLSVAQLVSTAWASASTFRGSDKRGGANGARIRLAPQKDWAVNQPAQLAKVLATLEGIQREFNARRAAARRSRSPISSCSAAAQRVEQAAKNAGHAVTVPFTPGRTDASQEQTDVESFAVLEPVADGFRNYQKAQVLGAGGGAPDRPGAAPDADRRPR